MHINGVQPRAIKHSPQVGSCLYRSHTTTAPWMETGISTQLILAPIELRKSAQNKGKSARFGDMLPQRNRGHWKLKITPHNSPGPLGPVHPFCRHCRNILFMSSCSLSSSIKLQQMVTKIVRTMCTEGSSKSRNSPKWIILENLINIQNIHFSLRRNWISTAKIVSNN